MAALDALFYKNADEFFDRGDITLSARLSGSFGIDHRLIDYFDDVGALGYLGASATCSQKTRSDRDPHNPDPLQFKFHLFYLFTRAKRS